MGNLTIWLTPAWILSLGVIAAAVIMLAIFGLTWLISRRTAEAMLRLERESILQWVSYLVLAFVAFGLLATPVMPVKQVTFSFNGKIEACILKSDQLTDYTHLIMPLKS